MITGSYAGLLALIFLWLSIRVILYRRRNQISLGDQGDKSLLKRMRAQANCAEYAPIGIVLLGIVELQGSPVWIVHVLDLMLLVGRGLHAYGFSASPPKMALRVQGTGLTLIMLALAALAAIIGAVV